MDLEELSKFAPLIPAFIMLSFSTYYIVRAIGYHNSKKYSYESNIFREQQKWDEIEQRNKEKYSGIFEPRT